MPFHLRLRKEKVMKSYCLTLTEEDISKMRELEGSTIVDLSECEPDEDRPEEIVLMPVWE
jgi:hypothetical protein